MVFPPKVESEVKLPSAGRTLDNDQLLHTAGLVEYNVIVNLTFYLPIEDNKGLFGVVIQVFILIHGFHEGHKICCSRTYCLEYLIELLPIIHSWK